MITCKRRIALAPMALVVLLTFTGCKTGLKHNFCGQTHCASTCLPQKGTGCLTTKESCATACGSSCLDAKGLCQKTSTLCGKTSCGSQCGMRCGSKCGCGSDCKCQTGCGSIACAIQPRITCNANCQSVPHSKPKIPYEAMPHQEPMIEKPTPAGPNPFEDAEPADAEKAKAPPMPMPKKGKKAKDTPQPIPAPPVGDDAAQRGNNPFLQVAQAPEWDASVTVPVSHVPHQMDHPEMQNAPELPREQLDGPKTYSKAWADALGLPSQGE